MAITILSDEVINATDLRTNQKKWLDKAYTSPISITNGARRLVILNRQKAKDMYLLNHYAPMVIQFCQEQQTGKIKESIVFPWIKHLDKKAILEFHKELLSTFEQVLHSKDWIAFEEMLDGWAATAEAMTNPEMMELLNINLEDEEFTRVE